MLNDVIAQLLASQSFNPLKDGIASGARRQWVSGVRGTGKSIAVAALAQARGADAPVHFLLTPSQERAENLFADLQALCGVDCPLQPVLCSSLESLLYEETSPDVNLIRDRLSVLTRLAAGEKLLVIATPDAALHRTLPPAVLGRAVRTLRKGQDVAPDELAAWLTVAGYLRLGMVDKPGQFSLRGGILDIFPSTDTVPVRLEYFGDEIDSLRVFETDTQRSV
ncbi:MAG: transcription-repair coupling factor, partial [bacterium]